MSEDMFKDYPQPSDYIPDNRHAKCACECHGDDIITVGATSFHTFVLDFPYSGNCSGFDVVYSNGVETPLVVSSEDPVAPYEMTEADGKTTIAITIPPAISSLFDPMRESYAQMRLTMNDGSVIYGDKNKIGIIGTLEAKREQ